MNKIYSKEMFIKNRIKTPKFFLIKKNDYKKNLIFKNINKKNIKYPIVLKPINEGSSLGVEICKSKKKLIKSINKLFKKYKDLILEEYIGGQEVQVAVINGNPIGAIELIPRRLFYDYKAKYTKAAKTRHLMPANLSRKNTEKYYKCKKSS